MVILLGVAARRLYGKTFTAARQMRTVLVCYGIQASLNALAYMLSRCRRASTSIEAVEERAEGIVRILGEREIVPNRLGIDGIPGSGKSTLARSLAAKLDMSWKPLDYLDLRLPGTLDRERTIFDHHRLFRTQDVDAFDVIVYIDEPVEVSRSRLRRRGRGLVLSAVLDHGKLKKVGKLAFDVCEGEPVAVPGTCLVMKVRPPDGFRALENIASRLGAASSGQLAGPDGAASSGQPDGPDLAPELDTRGPVGTTMLSGPSGMSKEEMLFLLACGSRKEGLRAYVLPLAHVAGSLTAGLCSVARRLAGVPRARGPAGPRSGALPSTSA